MMDKQSRFCYLFGIVSIIILMSSNGQALSKEYRNLYGDKMNSKLANFFGTGAGIIQFLNEGQRSLEEEIADMTPGFADIYDFVIVGAGTAGATVAARLSEISQVKVLLIEAGPNENLLMDIPMIVPFLQLSNDINWKYRTKSSKKYCLGMYDNSCNWPRGKVMGGTSVLNYLIATRGSPGDYDRWAEMGNEGWAYKDILKYFRKMETMSIPELQSDTTYHGSNGPLNIMYPPYHTPLAEAFLKAGEELGYPILDYNAENMIGFSYVQTTMINGTRVSSNRAYLHPARNRKNLFVTRESMVTKILIDRRNNRATGVELIKHGRTISIRANKEVILCAGAIGSPQLLMLSGIGPAKHLADLGIDVIKDAPVGENLMDHIGFAGLTYLVNAPVGIRLIDLVNLTYPYLSDFLTKRSGPLTIPGACEALGFINTEQPKERGGPPDVELLFSGGTLKAIPFLQTIAGVNDQIRQLWNKYVGTFGWNVSPIVSKPKSRGWIRLLANDINVKPEIVPNYYNHPDDVRKMIVGIRFAMNLGRSKAMQVFGSQLVNESIPGCEHYRYDSDTFWECVIRTIPLTLYHYSGTCKMAPRGDPTAVVDPKLKVIGVQGLRVADASIIPEIVRAHLNIPSYMIAEKLSDMVKEEWGYFKKG